MPANINMATLTPATLLAQGPIGSTRADMRDGTRGGSATEPGSIYFYEDFQDQPDWNNALISNDLDNDGISDREQSVRDGHTLPVGWFAAYQTQMWSESAGYPGGMESATIMTDPANAMPGKTKVCRMIRASDANRSYWNSDSSIMRLLDDGDGGNEVFLEAQMKFGPEWTGELPGGSKMLRITSWNMQDPIFRYFSDGNHGPIFIWLWDRTSYGVRMRFSFRGGPHSDNYTMTEDRFGGDPISIIPGGHGDMNRPWTSTRVGQGPNGTTSQLPDLVNGGYIPTEEGPIITNAQLFGVDRWFKIGMYVKMQSAVNVADGQVSFYLDDKRVFHRNKVNWCPTGIGGTQQLPKWNAVEIGGNDDFYAFPDSERVQQRYFFQTVGAYRGLPSWAERDT